jgi:lipid-A-disaccharide synthase
MPNHLRILISTGEISGDYHASNLVKAIRNLEPDAEFFAVGSENLKRAGAKILYDSSDWGGIGIRANLQKYPVTHKFGNELIRRIPSMNLDLIIVVDFRVFHTVLLKGIRDLDIGKLYYFAPVEWPGFEPYKAGKLYRDLMRKIKIWQTQDRFQTLSKLADKLIVAYPFGVEKYRNAGADVVFLGHPLMNAVKTSKSKHEIRKELGIDNNTKLIGIFPGSREHELRSHLPVLADTIRILGKELKNVLFYIPVAHPEHRKILDKYLGDIIDGIKLVSAEDYDLFAATDIALSKMGTSVQILMALGIPTVAFYTVISSLWYNISLRFLMKYDHIAFPNVLAGKRIIPEYIQDDFKSSNLAGAVMRIISDPAESSNMSLELLKLRDLLYREDALEKSAQIAVDLALKKRRKING